MGNPIVHWELVVSDLDKAKAFYAAVFDWNIEDSSAFAGYPMIDPGKEPRGAMWVKPDTAPGYGLTTYFGVDDVGRTLARAQAAGATVLVPPSPIEAVGEWAMFADPDGIPIGLFQAK
jgi:predicted enzyme related to lactoylglutathione lyase